MGSQVRALFVFGAAMTDVSLYHGDCLELLKDVPSKSVNMVLCDLPYGTTCNKWDSCINLDALWIEYKRVLAEGGGLLPCLLKCPSQQRYITAIQSGLDMNIFGSKADLLAF